MAKAPTLTTVTSGYYSTTALNDNFSAIVNAFNNTVSRDGSTPNPMNSDLDMNSQDITNAGDVYSTRLYLRGQQVVPTTALPDWKGGWVTATAYIVNDIVREDGNVYICLEDHTSGTFSTDLSATKWELFASKGSSGAGTGDMLAANNLSDVASADTALTNLGGGSVGIAIFKDTTAAAVRTEIGAQASDNTLTALAGLSTGANKIPYSTGVDTFSQLDFKDEDNMASDSATAVPSQQSVKAYVDAEIASVSTPSSMTLLATVATTSGTTVTSSTLNFSGYTKLEIYYNGVSVNSAASTAYLNMRFGSGGWHKVTEPITSASSDTLDGLTTVHLTTGSYSSVVSASDDPSTNGFGGSFGNVSAETTISWDWSAAQSFDAGQILIYGIA